MNHLAISASWQLVHKTDNQHRMNSSATSSTVHPVTASSTNCPLCFEAIDVDQPLARLSSEWREVLEVRERWRDVAEGFHKLQTFEAVAEALSLAPELVEKILQFLCLEICGCRRVICPACLDDYRNAL
ncbi:MAG: hypothetical protein AB1757_16685 [Acidobacteriota bacterium]